MQIDAARDQMVKQQVRAWDVLEVQPNVLLVTSNPGSNGFAYVVRIALDFVNGHSATRVAGGRIIRAGPEVERSSTGSFASRILASSCSTKAAARVDQTIHPITGSTNTNRTISSTQPQGVYFRHELECCW